MVEDKKEQACHMVREGTRVGEISGSYEQPDLAWTNSENSLITMVRTMVLRVTEPQWLKYPSSDPTSDIKDYISTWDLEPQPNHISDKLGYLGEDISKQNAEGMTWFLFAAYSKMQEEWDK